MCVHRFSGSLTLQCVDGCVVYMNGAEISRINMPAAPTVIAFATNALLVLNAIPAETVIPITDANVQDGVNVIAVEVSISAYSLSYCVLSMHAVLL